MQIQVIRQQRRLVQQIEEKNGGFATEDKVDHDKYT